MVTLSLPIHEARYAALRARAEREGKAVEAVLLAAVDDVLDDEAEFRAAVAEGLDDLKAGRVVDGDAVFGEVRELLAGLSK